MTWPRDLSCPIPARPRPRPTRASSRRSASRCAPWIVPTVGPATRVAVVGTGPIGLLVDPCLPCARRDRHRGHGPAGPPGRRGPRVRARPRPGSRPTARRTTASARSTSRSSAPAPTMPSRTALELVRPGGHVVLVGIPDRRPDHVPRVARPAQGRDDLAQPADAGGGPARRGRLVRGRAGSPRWPGDPRASTSPTPRPRSPSRPLARASRSWSARACNRMTASPMVGFAPW